MRVQYPLKIVRADDMRAHRSSLWGLWAYVHVWLAILSIVQCLLTYSGAGAQRNAKNVLLLFSSVEQARSYLNQVESALRGRAPEPINLYVANLVDAGAGASGTRSALRGIEAWERDPDSCCCATG